MDISCAAPAQARNAPAYDMRSQKSYVKTLMLECDEIFRGVYSQAHGMSASEHLVLQDCIKNLYLAFEKFHGPDETGPSVRYQTLQIGYGIIKDVVRYSPTEQRLTGTHDLLNAAMLRLAHIAYTTDGCNLIKRDFDNVYKSLQQHWGSLKAFVISLHSYTSVSDRASFCVLSMACA